jgi:hypothetical protein
MTLYSTKKERTLSESSSLTTSLVIQALLKEKVLLLFLVLLLKPGSDGPEYDNIPKYRISANSFRIKYSFLNFKTLKSSYSFCMKYSLM